MASTPSQPEEQPPTPVNVSTDAETSDGTVPTDDDKPVRILVQTKTHLVPGDKSTDFGDGERVDRMVQLICQHVWHREYDRRRERQWDYGLELQIDNRPCWFLIDHHGPDPVPIPDPPVVWYTWTGKEFVLSPDTLPRNVHRQLRKYPFIRLTAAQLNPPKILEPRPPPTFSSREAEIRYRRSDLRDTLAYGLTLLEEHVNFVQEHPRHAEWVKARVPAHTWARLDDPSQIFRYEVVDQAEEVDPSESSALPDISENESSPALPNSPQ